MVSCEKETDVGYQCPICECRHPTGNECKFMVIHQAIHDLREDVKLNWEMNYNAEENVSKRVKKIEENYVDCKLIYIAQQTLKTWQEGCEKLISDLQSRIKDIEYRLSHIVEFHTELDIRLQDVERKIEGLGNNFVKFKNQFDVDYSDHDERIHDLENIQGETRLIHLEQKMQDMEWLHEDEDGLLRNCSKKIQNGFRCPLCKGKGEIAVNEIANIDYQIAKKGDRIIRITECKSCNGEGSI